MCFALKPQLIDLSQGKAYLSGIFFVNDAAISAGIVSAILGKVIVFFVKIKKFVEKHSVFITLPVLLVLLLHLVLQQLPCLQELLHPVFRHLRPYHQELLPRFSAGSVHPQVL